MKNALFRWVIRVLALCLVLLAIPSVQALAAYSGTPETPTQITSSTYAALGLTSENWNQYNGYYGIRNAEELYGFAKLVNNGNRFAKAVLLQDIVVNETLNASAHAWTPIGTSLSNCFDGAFDGNGTPSAACITTIPTPPTSACLAWWASIPQTFPSPM